MFSTIVVGTDGSTSAGAAVELAVELARQSSATLHLVRAVSPGKGVSVPSGGASLADPSAGPEIQLAAAQRMLEGVKAGIDGVGVEIHAATGPPADVIIERADAVKADLIVVGSKGMQGMRRILGSIPNTVAHNAGCHVLIAKTT